MVLSEAFTDLVSTSTKNERATYSGLPVSDEFCPKSLSIYPSKTLEDNHITNKPAVFSIAVVIIFLFTSIVFVFYDLMVSRRQRIVMNRALASGAIVSSLFPEKVKLQLYQDNIDKREKEYALKNFLHNGEAYVDKSSKPIADSFEDTTILFADLAGFTAVCR